MTTEEHINFIQAYDYKCVGRAEFEAATDRPAGLLERSKKYPGAWVVYDPLADDEGFMIIGDDKAALAKEAYEHIDSLL